MAMASSRTVEAAVVNLTMRVLVVAMNMIIGCSDIDSGGDDGGILVVVATRRRQCLPSLVVIFFVVFAAVYFFLVLVKTLLFLMLPKQRVKARSCNKKPEGQLSCQNKIYETCVWCSYFLFIFWPRSSSINTSKLFFKIPH